MIRTYGQMPLAMPEGFFRAFSLPIAMLIDTPVGAGDRLMESGNNGVRTIPVPQRAQWLTGSRHDGAVPVGATWEWTFNEDTHIVSARGFLLDDDNGHLMARYLKTQVLTGNSVDLDLKAYHLDWASDDPEDPGFWDLIATFTEWNVGESTFVGGPAFHEAHGKLDDPELMASLLAEDPMEPLVANLDPSQLSITSALIDAAMAEREELHASLAGKPKRSAFFVPEADKPQKIRVTEDGKVFGHVALWDSCHEGLAECVIPPRPTDGYASFNKPGVLTDKGEVQTGPIFLYGGHHSVRENPNLEQAYGGVENAWCDGRVIEGVHGPWFSGIVRPGVPDDLVYAARASRISGHWVGGKLKAIVSVNAEGYDVPGDIDELAASLLSGGSVRVNDNDEVELFASFPRCTGDDAVAEVSVTLDADLIRKTINEMIASGELSYTDGTLLTEIPEDATEGQILDIVAGNMGVDAEVDTSAGDLLLALLLEEEDEL